MTHLPDFEKEIKEKAYIKILEFISLFGNMTEEEFIDKIDIRDSNKHVPIEQYPKFKGHKFKMDTEVCPNDIINEAWSNGPRYLLNTFYGIFIDVLNYITFIVTDPSKRMDAYLQYGTHRRKNACYSVYSLRDEYIYDLGNRHSGFEYTIPSFKPVQTFPEKSREMILDIEALYIMLIIYRMCQFYSKDAIDWWKHGMTGLRGYEKYTLQGRMREINRIRVYVNTMKADNKTLDEVLYRHLFL